MYKNLLYYYIVSFLFVIQWCLEAACPPGYVQCPNGSCSVFIDLCQVCKSGQLVCPNAFLTPRCAANYSLCPLLPFQNPNLPLQERVDDIVARLNLTEKVAQLMYPAPAIPLFGIPAYSWLNEALHGVAFAGLATSFPQVIGLGASFDKELWEEIGSAIGNEARAKYNYINSKGIRGRDFWGISFYAPNVNIIRDPRWGRSQEVPGEDPYLTGRYAVHFVRGMQGRHPQYYQVLACCKHYAAYDLDNVNRTLTRHNFNAIVQQRDMLKTYLPAFKACVREANVQSVMCSYNAINGVPACADAYLLTNVLRNEYVFEGFVISDYDAIANIWQDHHYVATAEEASAVAVKAGCDQDGGKTYESLIGAVQRGLIDEATIDQAVRRMFRARLVLGMFDPPEMVPYNYVPYSDDNSDKHKMLALRAAQETVVLLKNDAKVLPLDGKMMGTVAVIGPLANASVELLGNYNGQPETIVTIYEGIKARIPHARVEYCSGCRNVFCTESDEFAKAIALAKESDVIILVMGIDTQIENEMRDRTSLSLPGLQERLIQLLWTPNKSKPFVVIFVNGGSLSPVWTVETIPTILEVFYGGQATGTAVASILFGDYSPAGRLPYTWYRGMEQLPLYTDMNMDTKPGRTYRYFQYDLNNKTSLPLFPFGHGLSYTEFNYSQLILQHSVISPCQHLRVSVRVKNVGKVTSDEVTQVYISVVSSLPGVPRRELVGFTRSKAIPPNSERVLMFEITAEQMAIVNLENELYIYPGIFRVFVGGGQPDFAPVLSATVQIRGHATPLNRCSRHLSSSKDSA